nr:hypothetical protein [Tanacetum cinerariifolium]
MGHRMNLIKGLVETDLEGALIGFAEVVQMEPKKADWSASQNIGLLQEFYQATLKALEEAKNELCNIWFDMGEYGRMNKEAEEPSSLLRRSPCF